MPNDLEIGARRSGTMFDFSGVPEIQVTLERTERGICLVIPWHDPDSPYAAWFVRGDDFIQGVSTRSPEPVPRRLLFRDSHGSVLLVGCWPRGYHANFLGPGYGRVWARFAVLGCYEDLDFEHPHGLRTEVSGLREWTGLSSVEQSIVREGTDLHAVVTARQAKAIDIRPDLKLEYVWSLGRSPDKDGVVIGDRLLCTSSAETPAPWADALKPHLALRDLLIVSRWLPESCVAKEAKRNDDVRDPGDGAYWRQLVVPDDRRNPPPSGHREHLIKFGDLGPEGINRWLDLRESFARALDPVISSRFLDKVSAETLLAQIGPGIEALGYLLLLEEGLPQRRAAASTLRVRLTRITADIADVFPYDCDEWVSGTTEAYNSLKHANRALPDAIDVLNRWQQSVLAVRCWVALRLGVNPDLLTERLRMDPQRSEFVALN